MAIGDDQMDLHLIKAADYITTANGARQLKQAADAVTASNGIFGIKDPLICFGR